MKHIPILIKGISIGMIQLFRYDSIKLYQLDDILGAHLRQNFKKSNWIFSINETKAGIDPIRSLTFTRKLRVG